MKKRYWLMLIFSVIYITVMIAFGATKTTNKYGQPAGNQPQSNHEFQYETRIRFNKAADDLDSLFAQTVGAYADSLFKTAIAATRGRFVSIFDVDTAYMVAIENQRLTGDSISFVTLEGGDTAYCRAIEVTTGTIQGIIVDTVTASVLVGADTVFTRAIEVTTITNSGILGDTLNCNVIEAVDTLYTRAGEIQRATIDSAVITSLETVDTAFGRGVEATILTAGTALIDTAYSRAYEGVTITIQDIKGDTVEANVIEGVDTVYTRAGEIQRATVDSMTCTSFESGDTVYSRVVESDCFHADSLKWKLNPSFPANPNLYNLLVSSKVTIGHVGETGTDFAYATGADHVEQTLGTDTIPPFAQVVSVVLICTEALAGQTNITIDIGDGAGTDEFATAAIVDDDNEILISDVAGWPEVAPSASEIIIYVNGDPDDNTWADQTAGEWTLITTYLDYGSIE